jgi:hypothetical protein
MKTDSRSIYCKTISEALEDFNRGRIINDELRAIIAAADITINGQLSLNLEPKRKQYENS